MSQLVGASVASILVGVLYVVKPDLFRRGIWLKTSIAVRLLSETNYKRYMRGLGVVLILLGVSALGWGLLHGPSVK
jgi:hypothetical protein